MSLIYPCRCCHWRWFDQSDFLIWSWHMVRNFSYHMDLVWAVSIYNHSLCVFEYIGKQVEILIVQLRCVASFLMRLRSQVEGTSQQTCLSSIYTKSLTYVGFRAFDFVAVHYLVLALTPARPPCPFQYSSHPEFLWRLNRSPGLIFPRLMYTLHYVRTLVSPLTTGDLDEIIYFTSCLKHSGELTYLDFSSTSIVPKMRPTAWLIIYS